MTRTHAQGYKHRSWLSSQSGISEARLLSYRGGLSFEGCYCGTSETAAERNDDK